MFRHFICCSSARAEGFGFIEGRLVSYFGWELESRRWLRVMLCQSRRHQCSNYSVNFVSSFRDRLTESRMSNFTATVQFVSYRITSLFTRRSNGRLDSDREVICFRRGRGRRGKIELYGLPHGATIHLSGGEFL